MNHPQFKEIEIKFAIHATDIPALLQFLGDSQSEQKLSNTYYDTANYDLRKNGYGLRVRGVELRYELTLKSEGKSVAGLHERAEYNIDLGDNRYPDLALFPAVAWQNLQQISLSQLQTQLIPLFSTDFKRKTWLYSIENSQIEIALDQGQISANQQQMMIQELELELKHGNKQDLFDLALKLCHFNLHLFSQSKAARGYRLMNNQSLVKQSFAPKPNNDNTVVTILAYWQANEEYALANNDKLFYQTLLNQIDKALYVVEMNSKTQQVYHQWQQKLLQLDEVTSFAYSEVNNQLKILLLCYSTNKG